MRLRVQIFVARKRARVRRVRGAKCRVESAVGFTVAYLPAPRLLPARHALHAISWPLGRGMRRPATRFRGIRKGRGSASPVESLVHKRSGRDCFGGWLLSADADIIGSGSWSAGSGLPDDVELSRRCRVLATTRRVIHLSAT